MRTTTLLVVALLVGCAHVPGPVPSVALGTTGAPGECAEFFARLDARVLRAGVVDAAAQRIEGHPWLRVDRLLASFAGHQLTQAQLERWLDHAQRLDQQARATEIANLGDANPAATLERVRSCGAVLRAAAGDPREILAAAAVADAYIDARRVLGLYPLVRPFVASGVQRWHRRTQAVFSTAAPADAAGASMWWPPDDGGPATPSVPRDALDIAVVPDALRRQLFIAHAPVWQVLAPNGRDDRIGAPVWQSNGLPGVDVARPVTFTHLSHTRFDGDVLLQLNYVVWFPARPKPGPMDLYGGRLDGITWRVTLDRDGTVLLRESIHNCGCYYKAYPAAGIQARTSIPYAEPPLILDATQVGAGERVVVAVDSGSHYVTRVYAATGGLATDAARYALADYAELTRLPLPDGGTRSLFGQTGLVAGTQRLERVLLWPTGVASPGAMRQWGTHAVAFVGKRHFDDPFYMDVMFRRRPASASN